MNQPRLTGSPLVSCQWLADNLGDPGVRVLEISSSPDDTSFRQGHIPGATWWFWKDALWHPTDREFITPEELASSLGNLGIAPQTTVVLYGTPVQFGTYAFWVLTLAGHKNLRLLNGGKKRWSAEGHRLTRDEPHWPEVAYRPGEEDRSSLIGRDDVRSNLGRPGRLVLDVRSPEEYRGERVSPPTGEVHFDLDHGAERAGRIPGARHLYFRKLVN